MSRSTFVSAIVLVLVAWVVSMSLFTVGQTQYAILLRLGEFVRSNYQPGLHVKWPLINNVIKFDKRILTLDASPEEILTGEKKTVLVDYYVKWRIKSVEAYYLAYGSLESRARSRLSEVIKNGLQAEFNQRTIRQVVTEDRTEIMKRLAERANQRLGKFGIEIVDVRIKQIELPSGVRNAVFKRMRAGRDRIAKDHRGKGRKEATILEAQANRKRTEMLAGARRSADEIKGKGDARATEIYAKAYGQDPEFYAFYRSMMAYRDAFDSKQDVLVLAPDSEFFQYFNSMNPKH